MAPYARVVFRSEYAEVPTAPPDADVDAHWRELVAAGPGLPASYLPPSMSGPHPPWRRAGAILLIALLVTATAGGVCLTYGPDELFRLVRSA